VLKVAVEVRSETRLADESSQSSLIRQVITIAGLTVPTSLMTRIAKVFCLIPDPLSHTRTTTEMTAPITFCRVAQSLARTAMVGALIGLAGCAKPDSPITVQESYTRARAILDSAIAVHGGTDALRAAQRFRVSTEGSDFWRNQSRKVDPPYDSAPATMNLRLDIPAGRMIWERSFAFPGISPNDGKLVIGGVSPFHLAKRERLNYPQPGRTIAGMRSVLDRLPHLVLLNALDHASGLRWLGRMRLSSGAEVDVIATSTSAGPLTLGIDPVTRELRALLGVQADPLTGDATTETEFLEYGREGAILVPGRRVSRVAGEITENVRYSEAGLISGIADSLLVPPSGYLAPSWGAGGEPVRELASGVWAIQESGYWSLAVAFSDHVLVVEAPSSGVPAIITRLGALAPGKPIRFVIPTHHHDDHAGGVGHYVAAGATIVTTPGNRRYLERMANARSTLRPQEPGSPPRPPAIETVNGGRKEFTDGVRTVEIHDIGPSPHADEMLVAWIPAEGILYQSDLGPTEGPVNPNTNNPTTAHFAEWVRTKGWNVRIHVGAHGAPASMTALMETASQPITP
jgi:glyoxylase-like metal-dependent hydrolase (beta-lactamase superfamily II)